MYPEQPYYPPPTHGLNTIWRSNALLVMTKQASLPDRCIKCNAPTTTHLRRKLQWHHPALYLLIVISILVYAVVAMVVRKTAVVRVGLCKEHFESRKLSMIITVLLAFVGMLSVGAAVQLETPILGVIGFGLVIAAAVYGTTTIRVIAPTKIDEHFVWIKGVNVDFLQEFPEWHSRI